MLNFRKATKEDIPTIEKIYLDIHTEEENGNAVVGWIRGVYPTRQTAENALEKGTLLVGEDCGNLIGAAIINQKQCEEYKYGNWEYPAPENEIMVLHTLVISPNAGRKGYGKQFIGFYEEYALSHGCHCLRIDTNERNERARKLYKKLGFSEVGTVPCDFNGIKGVNMILLEKCLKRGENK